MPAFSITADDRRELAGFIAELVRHYGDDADSAGETIVAAIAAAARRPEWVEPKAAGGPSFAFVMAFARAVDRHCGTEEEL